MRTAKQILIEHDCLQEPDRVISTNSERFIGAMKEYAEQALDLASEEAYVDSENEWGQGSQVDKESILDLKSQLL